MTTNGAWADGVRVVQGATLDAAMTGPAGSGRATAFDFAGTGGHATWIGRVALAPNARTGAHHHGRHEVAVYVVRGRGELRWGERLGYAAQIAAGDFAYFAPFVPHQERNVDIGEQLEIVVVRSDNERIAVGLDVTPAGRTAAPGS
ncbi:cupin domain-containing protein [Desertibaculum subflavum]|uniref:cupin domain-containing protein n=1 Tax=Desertibaculum subflavum TaxID=2268458 RepID=UPI0034D168B2